MSQVWVMDKGWKLEIDDQGDDDVRPTTKRLLLAGWDCDKWSNNLTYLSIFLTIGLLVAFLLYCKHRDTKSNRQVREKLDGLLKTAFYILIDFCILNSLVCEFHIVHFKY
jgi:hypothetical protein